MTTNSKYGKAVGAMLGAAYGDALGWPNERPGKSKAIRQPQGHNEFMEWSRQSGGRFSPYEETIKAGEYSDDTQLILCLGRSLLKGGEWFDSYTRVELPFWSVYERGGGGAVKNAVASWLRGIEPWNPKRDQEDIKKYFEAGGNGVAMRVLPHVLYFSNQKKLSESIFLGGITTHGHPKALLGALAYGYALRCALLKQKNLGRGELIKKLITNKAKWSSLPLHDQVDPMWQNQAKKYLKDDYDSLWEAAKDEFLKYLDICKSELAQEALSDDNKALTEIQCFNKQTGGAGTVTAAAAIYLASRHADAPITGVVTAAHAKGSDTDTIASMTGGLLGCIAGTDWLSSVKSGIQDYRYLEEIALQLSNRERIVPKPSDCEPDIFNDTRSSDDVSNVKTVKGLHPRKWKDSLVSIADGGKVELPDGRVATVRHGKEQIGSSGKYKVAFRTLNISDGQTIYINKITKGDFANWQHGSATPVEQAAPGKAQPAKQSERLNLGPKLPVSSIEPSLSFYRDMLGLTVKKETKDTVAFHQGIVLTTASYYSKESQGREFRSLLYVEVTNITGSYDSIQEQNTVVTELGCWKKSKRRFFRCRDPDGNLVEVFEKQ